MDKLSVNKLFLSATSPSQTRRLSLVPLFTKSTSPSPSRASAGLRRKSMIESLGVAEARREADEKRNAKYAKMERQREEVRQNIREKYNIKKKEEPIPSPCEGRLTADKKGPIPLPDDDDSFDPIKMATDALNTISEKLPFKLPWK
ncbi:unnamed protein product [Rotaria socialis]|uniref:Complexin n=2 Tax=Rotaria socialis TaxID=392032 RepID=A0A818EIQ4_9BILA|nr:unnamed protein product [Rotaria socialis]CAF3337706.1 unnamed protein product [Rotaria socialis]CAF3459286.1 unnamed protein product [Rotaria socialis]CAF3517862.1 unnamed protein product [Rotaria socialis]CAF3581585.1 unnamed protein product [Rotaria socialis]